MPRNNFPVMQSAPVSGNAAGYNHAVPASGAISAETISLFIISILLLFSGISAVSAA